jgi:hypothetical protein
MEEQRDPFEKFVDSPYYAELELCEGAVTDCFSKYLLWQAMHTVNAPPISRKSKRSPRTLQTALVVAPPF